MSLTTLKPRFFVSLLMLVFSLACIQAPVHAAMIGTDVLVAGTELEMQRDALREQLMRDDVMEELLALGVDPATVNERVNRMTAAEISQVQGQLDSLPAGSGLGTAALVLLILILLEIAGVIDIFPGL